MYTHTRTLPSSLFLSHTRACRSGTAAPSQPATEPIGPVCPKPPSHTYPNGLGRERRKRERKSACVCLCSAARLTLAIFSPCDATSKRPRRATINCRPLAKDRPLRSAPPTTNLCTYISSPGDASRRARQHLVCRPITTASLARTQILPPSLTISHPPSRAVLPGLAC